MSTSYRTPFIIGGFFITLFILMGLLGKSILTFRTGPASDVRILADTDDLLVTRQYTENDLLPSDLPLVTFIDPKRGTNTPLVTLVEFSDYSCPYCKDSQDIVERLLEKYPDTLRHVWKDAANLGLYPSSMIAHIAARCSQEQVSFWAFHDELFEQQGTFSNTSLRQIAESLGLDMDTWQSCFDTEEVRGKVERGLIEAEALGVDGTPYFFVNDVRVSGAASFDVIDGIIEAEINKQTVL